MAHRELPLNATNAGLLRSDQQLKKREDAFDLRSQLGWIGHGRRVYRSSRRIGAGLGRLPVRCKHTPARLWLHSLSSSPERSGS
jgi:hypothetical protein